MCKLHKGTPTILINRRKKGPNIVCILLIYVHFCWILCNSANKIDEESDSEPSLLIIMSPNLSFGSNRAFHAINDYSATSHLIYFY